MNETENTSMDEGKNKTFVFACGAGQMDIIDSLIAEGIDVNCVYNDKTGLLMACSDEDGKYLNEPWRIDVVTKLIVNGANVDYENSTGWNALDEVLDAEPFNLDVASLLLDCSKLGINRLDNRGRNYLWSTNGLTAVKFLVDNGIDLDNVYNCSTFLDKAILWGYNDIANYLKQKGAKRYKEL